MTDRASFRYWLSLMVALGCFVAGCGIDNRDTIQGTVVGNQDPGKQASADIDVQTARQLLRADLDEVLKMLRPAKFTRIDPTGVSEVPLSCDLPDGREGKSYRFKAQRSVTHIDDPEARANLIRDHWQSKGYTVQLRTELGFQVLAQTREGGNLTFIAGEPGMTLGGESACAPA